MPDEISETNVVCPDCNRRLTDDASKFEFCGVNVAETGFVYVCDCGKEFIVPFEKSE